jgi:hypothetical protein
VLLAVRLAVRLALRLVLLLALLLALLFALRLALLLAPACAEDNAPARASNFADDRGILFSRLLALQTVLSASRACLRC